MIALRAVVVQFAYDNCTRPARGNPRDVRVRELYANHMFEDTCGPRTRIACELLAEEGVRYAYANRTRTASVPHVWRACAARPEMETTEIKRGRKWKMRMTREINVDYMSKS